MYINQFSVVVFKRQHYAFHIFTGYTFVRHFPVLQIQRPQWQHQAGQGVSMPDAASSPLEERTTLKGVFTNYYNVT